MDFPQRFKGASEAGDKVRVRLWMHQVWYLHASAEIEDLNLVAALAFIHRERFRCG